MTADRVLPLEGVNNFRDYGGYAVPGGGRVKRAALWRDEDLAAIGALSIATVIDLRGENERQTNPCRRPAGFAAQVLICEGENASLSSHIDAGSGVVSEEDARAAMCRLYSEMPYRTNLVGVLRRYFAALAEREGASLIHCFAGKDRTGFAVAITHHALGVHHDDAMQDYLLTNAATVGRDIPGNAGQEGHKYASLSEAASNALRGVSPEYLDAAFAAMRDSHGSADGYLAEVLGVDDALRARLRGRLIET